MDIKAAIAHVVAGNALTEEQMIAVMRIIMTGQATDAQIGGFLVALRMKGESIEEITGAATVMRELVTRVEVGEPKLVDTCGTGGDGSNLFNVSTASAFVAAATGVKVAKHGNRSITSATGSADVLEAAGINVGLKGDEVARSVREVGLGFMFAPAHHSAMKYAIGPRKELGLRTIFNVLGPLTNPAGAKRQVLGVFDADLCRTLAEVLNRLGSEHVLVVHSEKGMDEFALNCATRVAELKNGQITEYSVTPEDMGLATQDMDDLRVASAAESLALIEAAFAREQSPKAQKASDMIALNAGAALYVGGVADTIKQGVNMAEDTIASGLAAEKIKQLAEFTRCFS